MSQNLPILSDNPDFDTKFSSFCRSQEPTPSDTLLRITLLAIKECEAKLLRKKIVFFGAALFFSLLATVLASLSLSQEMANSGFAVLLNSFFTDFSLVMSHWSDFISSVLETLPVITLIATLTSTLCVLLFTKSLASYMKAFRHAPLPPHLKLHI